MKYVTYKDHYFRQEGPRIKDYNELRQASKEQNATGKMPFTFSSALEYSIIFLFLFLGGLLLYGKVTNIENFESGEYLLWPFFIALMGLGLLNVFGALISALFLNIKCTSDVVGTCVGYDDYVYHGKYSSNISSCPVYSFTTDNRDYLVYDGFSRSNESDLPRIGDSVRISFDPSNPERCIINNKIDWHSTSIFIGALMALFSLVLLYQILSVSPTFQTKNSNDKIILTDEYLQATYNRKNEDTDIYVYEVEVTEIDENIIYFKTSPGLSPCLVAEKGTNLEDCDTLYIVKFSNPNIRDVYFDADKYEYDGDIFTETSLNSDGKFELTDEYLDFYTECISWDIYDVTINSISDHKVNVIDKNGRDFNINYDSKFDMSLFGLSEGDEVYLVDGIHGGVFFDKDYNYYEGVCK